MSRSRDSVQIDAEFENVFEGFQTVLEMRKWSSPSSGLYHAYHLLPTEILTVCSHGFGSRCHRKIEVVKNRGNEKYLNVKRVEGMEGIDVASHRPLDA